MERDEEIDVEIVSKSQLKRERQELKALGVALVDLSKQQLEAFPLSEKIRDAIISAKSLKQGALKRQLQYIGSLMQDEDEEGIRQGLYKIQQSHKQAVKDFHDAEQWRDGLLAGDNQIMDELASKFETIDRQYIGQLIRNAKKEKKMEKPPKSSRLLFKYLTELQNQ